MRTPTSIGGRLLVLALTAALGLSCSGDAPRSPVEPGSTALRILPTNAAAVDFLVDLVGVECIVGLPYTALEFACAPIDGAAFEGGGTFDSFTAEVLLAFDPQIVVVSPWQNHDTIERLESAGVRIVTLPVIEDLDDVRAGLVQLGAELDAEERATELLAELDARVAALAERTARTTPLRAVSYTNYGSGGWAAGSGCTADVVIRLAGLTNAVAESGRSGHDSIDIEGLLTLDPDLFVVSRPSETYGVTRAYLEGEEGLAGMACMQAGAIVEVPTNLYSTTSHYVVAAAEALADGVEALGL
ncbi:MAG: ABC transporter substrate-binding protein [Planctomycetota bacterium]|nr:ABC transporter substrate-binding protein [Planctomycetota bacterium]